jgi:hypothetical protein
MAQNPGISTASCNASGTDRVGEAHDLIAPGCAAFIHPCGSIHALATNLKSTATDRTGLAAPVRPYNLHIRSSSPEKNVSAAIEAIRVATLRPGECSRRSAPSSLDPQNAAAPQKSSR